MSLHEVTDDPAARLLLARTCARVGLEDCAEVEGRPPGASSRPAAPPSPPFDGGRPPGPAACGVPGARDADGPMLASKPCAGIPGVRLRARAPGLGE